MESAVVTCEVRTVCDDVVGGASMATPRHEEAFDAEFARLLRHAYNVGWRFFRDRGMAEEVAQETLTRAYVRWPKVRHHPTPEGWVIVAATKVAQELGRKWRRPDISIAGPAVSFDEDPFQHPELLAALRRLSERQRQVFVLRHAFDQSVEETARHLALSESQVKDATHEAGQKLRRLLRIPPAISPASPAPTTPDKETA